MGQVYHLTKPEVDLLISMKLCSFALAKDLAYSLSQKTPQQKTKQHKGTFLIPS